MVESRTPLVSRLIQCGVKKFTRRACERPLPVNTLVLTRAFPSQSVQTCLSSACAEGACAQEASRIDFFFPSWFCCRFPVVTLALCQKEGRTFFFSVIISWFKHKGAGKVAFT